MENDYILTQTKKVVMTPEKTVTKITEKLETVDIYGQKKCVESYRFEVEENNDVLDFGRAA